MRAGGRPGRSPSRRLPTSGSPPIPSRKGLSARRREAIVRSSSGICAPAFGHTSSTRSRSRTSSGTSRPSAGTAGSANAQPSPNLLTPYTAARMRRGLVANEPGRLGDRPREPRRRWRSSPAEVGRVERAFVELIGEAEDEERAWREQARVIFLRRLTPGSGVERCLGCAGVTSSWRTRTGRAARARDVGPEPGGESEVGGRGEDDRARASSRRRALPAPAAHGFQGDDERVFVSPTGTPFDVARYARRCAWRSAKAGIERPVRPFHDGRHTAITNSAASGNAPPR